MIDGGEATGEGRSLNPVRAERSVEGEGRCDFGFEIGIVPCGALSLASFEIPGVDDWEDDDCGGGEHVTWMDEAGGVDEDEEVLGRDDEVGWEVRESGNEVDDMGGEDARFGSGEGVFPGFGDRQERLGLNDFGVASEDLRSGRIFGAWGGSGG